MTTSTWAVRLGLCAAVAAVACEASLAHANATINITPGSGMTPEVLAGFQAAANYWSGMIQNNITLNFSVNSASLSDNVLAQTSGPRISYSYPDVRNALTSHATSANDLTAVSHLPAGTSLSFKSNNLANGNPIIDNNATVNNNYVQMTYANAKALGFLAATANTSDGTLSFTNRYAWDFDRSDGISANAYDFVGVAIHEIGHALGFVSGADYIDQFSYPNGASRGQVTTMDDRYLINALDLYRYDAAGEMSVATTGVPYFSIDGGTTNLGLFSTGAYNGDGNQASHWKDDVALGVMDPTFAAGEFGVVSSLDLQAFDVIGYQIAAVPEPASIGMLLIAGLPLLIRRRGK